MIKYKPIGDHRSAALRFLDDVGRDTVRTYDIPHFSADSIPSVYPAAFLDKCTHATVGVSGSPPEMLDWMVICPYRVDRDSASSGMVYDIDPLIITLDAETSEPYPVAVVGYHQNFRGRTTPIANFGYTSIDTTVEQLRQSIVGTSAPMAEIPSPVEAALHHMAEYFRRVYGVGI